MVQGHVHTKATLTAPMKAGLVAMHFLQGLTPSGVIQKIKEICLLNKPFALKWVAFHVVGIKTKKELDQPLTSDL